ncbi:MAG TPA: MarR family transcriptional regulator [Chloroflexia bacterium]|nr:MarR family transcriptional regulator [Chloroflexia bacterium]
MQIRKHIGQLLWGPYRAHLLRLHEALAEAGYPDIQPTHGNNLFRHLHSEGSRITDIAEQAQLTKQHIGNLVDYLEERGYVERIPDPTDGRAKLVRLTDKGRELERTAEDILDRLETRLATRLGPERYAALRALLEELDAVLAP